MTFNSVVTTVRGLGRRCPFRFTLVAIFMIYLGGIGTEAQQCSFTSPSDGSDGDYDLTATPSGTTVYFKSSAFKGSSVTNNVFNFNKVTIPVGVTVKFTENVFHGPVYWLATSDVNIAGVLDLSGSPGVAGSNDPTTRNPAVGGSGGYPGGVGGEGSTALVMQPGGGPGGGGAGIPTHAAKGGFGGTFAGSNDFLVPLVGGSGGGGEDGVHYFGGGGGGGGGAILIASSSSIALGGTITVQGGNGGSPCGGAGSGGAVLLVSNSVIEAGGAFMNATGGGFNNGDNCVETPPTPGLIRVEGCTINLGGQVSPGNLSSTPVKLFVPQSPNPRVQVTSVNGTAITENPFTFPDIQIGTSSSIPVVITAHHVPLGTVPTLYILSENGDQQLQCPAAGLQGTTIATSTCTINLTFPFGGSRGFVKAAWTQ